MKPGIIDYGGGNLQSVRNAVRALGYEPAIVKSDADLAGVSALVYPGQGAFADCMNALNRQGLTEPLKEWINADRPFFGICVGYQVLFESGEEDPGVPGLGILQGKVVRFPTEPGLKVPHMGWNNVTPVHSNDPAWVGLGMSPYFYFVHSYYPEPLDGSVTAGVTNYAGRDFAAAVQRGRMIATQFHPEKSQAAGQQLLKNFLTRFA
ncbi:MAG TPA: imidazole glycerol phosphate synthase subunit HisH [Verrucomicrobiales bacterium]|nr:imidazole glycerol phosphate synthase subunit HisH [Verrucomicrobiales bacterium]